MRKWWILPSENDLKHSGPEWLLMLVEKCLAELPEVISNFFMLMWLVLSVIVSYSLEIRDGQPKLTGWCDLCNIAGMLTKQKLQHAWRGFDRSRNRSCSMLKSNRS